MHLNLTEKSTKRLSKTKITKELQRAGRYGKIRF